MGKPKFPRKKYDTPLHPWKEDRIKSEREMIKKYGLKNNREVWKAKTYLKKYREQARDLSAKMGGNVPQVKKESDQLLIHLARMGVTPSGASLDDVLALETESILSRRLQTLVYHRGLANTVSHARQLVSHGHIAIGDRRVTIPGYMVPKDEEKSIGYTGDSPLNIVSHPARPKTDVYKTAAVTTTKKEVAEKKEDKDKKAEEPKETKTKEEKEIEKAEIEEPETKKEGKIEEKPEEVKTEEKPVEEHKEESSPDQEIKEESEPKKESEDVSEEEPKESAPVKEQNEDKIKETTKKEGDE